MSTVHPFYGQSSRYEVIAATPTHLALGLHLDEVPKTALNRVAAGATGDDADCQPRPTTDHRERMIRLPVAAGLAERELQALREGLWLCDPARGDYG